MSLIVSLCAVLVLAEIWDLISFGAVLVLDDIRDLTESVSEGFPTYSIKWSKPAALKLLIYLIIIIKMISENVHLMFSDIELG